ncbi:uncharacterized protein [Eurosta solidaginis]|uniref:uncharacterized protein n=1 Tax=Eurosta solidaginis TaxID=178769 RepID=UPI003530E83E
MRESLKVCGKILTTDDYHFFALACEKCEASFGQWTGFLKHLTRKHKLDVTVKKEFEKGLTYDSDCEEHDVNNTTIKDEIEKELNKLSKYRAGGSDSEDSESDNEFITTKHHDKDGAHDNDDRISCKSEESAGAWNMDDDNKMGDTSSDDDVPLKDINNERKHKTFTFNLNESHTQKISNKFLKILHKYPILWDQQHANYWVPEKRTRVLYTIKQIMTKLGYTVSDYQLRSTIQRIVRDHKAAKQELAVCGFLNEEKALLLKKCKFLDGDKKDEGNEGEQDDSDDEEDLPLPDDFDDDDDDDDDFSINSDAEANAVNNPETINAFVKDSRDGKRICFNMGENPLIDEYVNLVRQHPILWEVGQFQGLNERKRIIESWIPIFQEKYNVSFVYRDLALNLKILRRTLTTLDERKVLSKSAQRLKDMCSFLPRPKPIIRMQCEHCDRKFLTEYTLQAHRYAAHNIGTNPFKCDICGRDFQAHSQLDTHLRRVHLKAFSVYCDVCNRGFLQESAMKLHRQTHTGEKYFVCETCGKTFRRKINLQQHVIRIHLRQRNFPCELCPKEFYLKCHLRDHMNAHLNIRNHKCPFCGKAFHSSHALMRHKQIHSEIKKYACKLCDARFHQFVGLNSHMKNKHKFVHDKDDEIQPQPIVHMTTLPATTTTPDPSMQIKGEIVQSMDSWTM